MTIGECRSSQSRKSTHYELTVAQTNNMQLNQSRLEAKMEKLAQIKQLIEDEKALLTDTICPSPPKDRSLASILSEKKRSKSRHRSRKNTFSRSHANEFCVVLFVIAIIIAIVFRLFIIKDFINLNYV